MSTIRSLVCSTILCIAVPAVYGQTSGTAANNSAGSKEDLSVMAGKMLDQTNKARTEIKQHDKSAALREVEQAQAELRNIQRHANGATTIPVYQEFVSVSILKPVQAEQASRHANLKNVATVHQVAGDYTDVTVNTTVAEKNLSAAHTALDEGNLKLADQALADVQEGVSIDEVEADMPLARARENLILARSAAEKGNYTEAHAALTAASKALSNYSSEGGRHSSDANSLKQQIDSYNQNLQQNHSDAVAKINQWWNTTSDWTSYKSKSS